MPITNKLGEQDISDAVLYVLIDGGRMSTTRVKTAVREVLEPEGDNLMPLLHRNDEAIDQIIRNIVSHREDSSSNIIYRGLVTYDAGYWEITPAGRRHFRHNMKNRYKQELD